VSHPALAKSQRFLDEGNLYLAYHTLETARDPERQDPAIEREYRRVRPLYLLERGRELVYEEQEIEGIEYFSRVLAIDPNNQEAKDWIQAARSKLARESTAEGDERRFTGQLELALKAYAQALEYVPGYPAAEKGKREVAEHFEARHNKAQSHVRDGNRRLEEQRHPEAFHDGGVALELDPSVVGAQRLYDKSQRELAERRADMARKARDTGKYGAALGLFKQAKDVVQDLPGIDDDIVAMENEVAALTLKTAGAMSVARAIDNPETPNDEVFERLDQAEERLKEAYELSRFERPAISELLLLVRDKRLERRYTRAADLIRSGRHQAGLEMYQAIDADGPNGYLDVKARITSLEEEIALAEEAYLKGKAAEEAGNLTEAIGFYKDANLYCRNYKGLEAYIEGLQVRQQ